MDKVGKVGKICKVDTARKNLSRMSFGILFWVWVLVLVQQSFSKVDPKNAAADRRGLPVTSALPIHSVQAWCSR